MKKDISKLQIKIINAVSKGLKSVQGPDADDFGMRVFCLEAMDSANAKQIEDMAAFVDWSIAADQGDGWIGSQLLHDLSGLANNEPCFSPRTAGYSDPNRMMS
jgi:hypothetical protein